MRLGISIHALLAESDLASILCTSVKNIFLSTLSLRRATHNAGPLPTVCKDFYPRSPCGERRQTARRAVSTNAISIHALLAESDAPRRGTATSRRDFYPRSPCGERPLAMGLSTKSIRFLSTLSLRRATLIRYRINAKYTNFYPRSPCGERHRHGVSIIVSDNHFYPRSPCGERQ